MVEPNIVVGPRREFSSARAMVQLSHSITYQHTTQDGATLQVSAITILPHPLTSKHQYPGKLRIAGRKLWPGEGNHVQHRDSPGCCCHLPA